MEIPQPEEDEEEEAPIDPPLTAQELVQRAQATIQHAQAIVDAHALPAAIESMGSAIAAAAEAARALQAALSEAT